MVEEVPFNWSAYEKLCGYFGKNSGGSLSQLSDKLGIPISELYEPLRRLTEKDKLIEKIFPGNEAYFIKREKNA